MSINNSIALKKRWEKISPEERSRRSSHAATIKNSKMSTLQKRKHAMLMVKARKNYGQ